MMLLTKLRQANGWSKSKLARAADLNQVTVSQIESGRWRPYDSQLLKLARALGLSEDKAGTLLDSEELPDSRSL